MPFEIVSSFESVGACSIFFARLFRYLFPSVFRMSLQKLPSRLAAVRSMNFRAGRRRVRSVPCVRSNAARSFLPLALLLLVRGNPSLRAESSPTKFECSSDTSRDSPAMEIFRGQQARPWGCCCFLYAARSGVVYATVAARERRSRTTQNGTVRRGARISRSLLAYNTELPAARVIN